jgi:hypothetical protein
LRSFKENGDFDVDDKKNSGINWLRPYERHVACILTAILLALSYISISRGVFTSIKECKKVSIHVVGAVNECTVLVPIGATADDVLQQVLLTSKADILEIDGNKKFFSDDTLVIPFEDKLTLYVTGSIEQPQVLLLHQVQQKY